MYRVVAISQGFQSAQVQDGGSFVFDRVPHLDRVEIFVRIAFDPVVEADVNVEIGRDGVERVAGLGSDWFPRRRSKGRWPVCLCPALRLPPAGADDGRAEIGRPVVQTELRVGDAADVGFKRLCAIGTRATCSGSAATRTITGSLTISSRVMCSPPMAYARWSCRVVLGNRLFLKRGVVDTCGFVNVKNTSIHRGLTVDGLGLYCLLP